MIRRLIPFLALSVSFLCGCEVLQPENAVSLRKSVGLVAGGYTFLSVQSEREWSLEVIYPEGQYPWVELSRTQGSGTLNSIIVSFDENEQWDERVAVIKAHFLNETLEVILRQKGRSSLKSGGQGTILPTWENYPGLESEVLPGWIELPAVYEIEGCAWVHHDMNITNVYRGRNYSVFYDATMFMPRWIAYPLNPSLSGSGSRSEKWNQWDPKIPQEYQPATQSGWGLDGYHRGHMLPSADRVANDEANYQTFYPTNMTVQNGVLNSGVWMSLETYVRSWSKQCDTLYVVTGAVPSSRNHIDRGGNIVNIPEGYYKALLKYSKGKSVSDTYSGIAFYLKNTENSGVSVDRKLAMPICDLENRLGINFFINLPDEYLDYAERRVRYSDWGL